MATPPAGSAEDPTGAQLLALHRSGRLLSEYPRVRSLLDGVSGPALARCGQLLSRLDPDDVLREHPDITTVTMAVTGHSTLSLLMPSLTAETARHGLLLRPHMADFDSYVFDLSDPDSDLYAAGADLVLCVLDPMIVFDELPAPWTADDAERVLAEKLALLEQLIARFHTVGRGTLVLNTMPLPSRYTAQLVDHRSRARLGALWREAGARLLRLTETHPRLVVIDLDPLIAEGLPATDDRLGVYAKAHLSSQLLARYAREIGHLARHLTGRTKKALLLDLDGTLWEGTLGEDGSGVLDGDGSTAFRSFQRVVKQIGAQGVLLAVVSKNDAEPVREILRDHPDMVLREEDFVRITANWAPKHDNITELAGALNLATDSFVFVDDSPYECALVAGAHPGIAVVGLGDDPACHAWSLLRDGWFDTLELTGEDRTRVAKYQQELVRHDFLQRFDTIENHLRELRIEVRVGAATEPEVARVSQLTLRTNQFNLTVERMQPAEVRAYAETPGARVLAVHARDRFGDNGLVGAVFLRREADTVHIDNFVLSCRVFSRGIEQACLSEVLRTAEAAGAREVLGRYRRAAKNGTVKDFFPRYGFKPLSDDGTNAAFRHDLGDLVPVPDHLHLTPDNGGDAP
uniref:Putative FKbH-like protein n=1 Tax=Streptomyces versipellis TaxID=67375 RepID=A0A0B6VRG4_9ACTN|nr:putative FKbH-like protein [Streptomyces versipellis]